MAYFPLFTDLAGKPVLIIGGGAVALRKIQKLLPFEPCIRVVAPEIHPEIRSLPDLCLSEQAYRPGDEEGMALVIAATSCSAVNREISDRCRASHIPVNVVDNPALCTFLFPALVQRGKLTVGISTGGSSPTAAVCLKEQIGALLPERTGEILDYLYETREQIRAACPDESHRHVLLKRLFSACMAEGRPLTETETQAICKEEHS